MEKILYSSNLPLPFITPYCSLFATIKVHKQRRDFAVDEKEY